MFGKFELNNIYNEDSYKAIKDLDNSDNYIIVTDPPFNINFKYNEYKDKLNEQTFYNNLSNLLKNKKCVVIMYPEMLHKLSIYLGYPPVKVISWVYNSHLPREHRDIAFYNIKPDFNLIKQPYKNLNDKRIIKMINKGSKGTNIYDWWKIEQVKNVSHEKYNHPCQMPLQVMKNIINILPKDKIIIEPFLGTGTTCAAAKELNRNYIGFEIDKFYYKIASDRLNGITANGQTSIFTDFEELDIE